MECDPVKIFKALSNESTPFIRAMPSSCPAVSCIKVVATTCHGCFPCCSIQVRRKDGKVNGSRGDPNVDSSYGKCCGKSMSRVADLYNPNRVTKPLVRTNPEKGIGVDPKWKEISWEEAMDMVVEKLEKLRKEVDQLFLAPLCRSVLESCEVIMK